MSETGRALPSVIRRLAAVPSRLRRQSRIAGFRSSRLAGWPSLGPHQPSAGPLGRRDQPRRLPCGLRCAQAGSQQSILGDSGSSPASISHRSDVAAGLRHTSEVATLVRTSRPPIFRCSVRTGLLCSQGRGGRFPPEKGGHWAAGPARCPNPSEMGRSNRIRDLPKMPQSQC